MMPCPPRQSFPRSGGARAMKLSTKGRYAMVALTDLATAPEGALLSLAELSKRQNISLPYLEQLFVKLRRAGLVDSVRGPGGGYRLGRAASEIRVSDILGAVDETVSAMHTGAGASGGARRSRPRRCASRSPSRRPPRECPTPGSRTPPGRAGSRRPAPARCPRGPRGAASRKAARDREAKCSAAWRVPPATATRPPAPSRDRSAPPSRNAPWCSVSWLGPRQTSEKIDAAGTAS